MEMKQLGNTGVMVPEIGIGVWRYSGGVDPLRRGVELGASLIDTAEVYGTEDVVAAAVRGIRDRVFIATKVSGAHLRHDECCRRRKQVCAAWAPAISTSIRSTGRPRTSRSGRRCARWKRWSIAWLVRYIGVSNFSTPELRAAQAAMSKYPVVCNQVLYNLNHREIERDLIPHCLSSHVTVMAYTPLDDGRLAALPRFRRNKGMQALGTVAAEVGKSPAQVALNWCTSRPNVITIPKSNSAARVAENCGASGWRLSPGQVQLLDAAFA